MLQASGFRDCRRATAYRLGLKEGVLNSCQSLHERMGLGDERIVNPKAVSKSLRCVICTDVFIDPVSANRLGHCRSVYHVSPFFFLKLRCVSFGNRGHCCLEASTSSAEAA